MADLSCLVQETRWPKESKDEVMLSIVLSGITTKIWYDEKNVMGEVERNELSLRKLEELIAKTRTKAHLRP